MTTLDETSSREMISAANAERVDMKLEAVVIPVADVDRSKQFYTKLGWRLDADFPFENGFDCTRRLACDSPNPLELLASIILKLY